eukprot:TRINITY_DN3785_c0_g1_i1.p1 TRINITY_DN3785_c0_g1~~TRINITY_DN3785_c0_g1_i1.p1  ORF type:complete len:665 (+),score=166.25 TRINITY_DN3785_c0_g1_i1:24-1997(+)
MAGASRGGNMSELEDQEPLRQPQQRKRWLRLRLPRPRLPGIRCGSTRVRSRADSREARQPSSQEAQEESRQQELDAIPEPEDVPAAEPSRLPESKAEVPRADSQPEVSVPEPELFENPQDFVDEVPPEFLIQEQEEPPLPAPAEPVPAAARTPSPAPSPAPSVVASSGRQQRQQPQQQQQRFLQPDPESESEREPFEEEGTDDISLNMIKLESWKVKPFELSLGDVLPAKTAAISGIAEAIAQFEFEKAKDLKVMRDLLAMEQASLWKRLFHCRHLHRQVADSVELAIKAEDFDAARAMYEVQRTAEDCIKGFGVKRHLLGSALMGNGYLDLGFASDLGLLRESFTVECWVYFETLQGKAKVFHPKPSAVGGLPTLTVAAGHVELKRRNGQAHSALVKFSEKHWSHLAFTWRKTADGDFDVNVFQDGLQVAFGKEQRGITTDSEVRLGSFAGKMTEFRIWNHARSKEQIEAWMLRRCRGDEEGLHCCLSLTAGQEFTDATLDPGSALEPGHHFAVRGSHRGEVTFDGDHPPELKSWQEAEQRDTDPASGIHVSFDEDCLAKAWRWLDGQHVEEAKRRKEDAERRLAEEEVRKREEQLRREEELRRQAEEKERRAKEDELRRKEEAIQAKKEEAERRRERRMRPFKKLMNCGTCTGGF